ncbi:hypothetical protein FGSG_05242 [Fusarium graminearum PH-1]|uniref:hypothetical protein n=1 Tax=Gibberella zeae (strain ATCC MYA-4620 / CBS 123657 / FGSC 9075 / NRRL 31084 / PH-1) TaxID=229533 RepID=UPI00021F144C|nr:hypothetical protein FGSG_05242 [Fusarium graminearum PH-1]ESU11177.1 hypothetical protein FGSG_05242 [Fusarium graminearum PH-1]|eukprot:XP_011323753.1 hypothetical protein FGSG_05242 [Fusarium graminearum PH-1]
MPATSHCLAVWKTVPPWASWRDRNHRDFEHISIPFHHRESIIECGVTRERRCQNFETLEDQLHSIQNDLSDLTSLVRGGNSVRSSSLAAEEWAPDNLAGTDSGPVAHTNCHIVRDASQSLDRYHGPCSLYALCKEFHDDPIFGVPDNNTSTHTAEHAMLQEMLYKASNEPHLDIPSQPTGICLPPRQFLNLVIGPFFKNTDYATDVFVRSAFQLQIDRIYSQPIVPSDEGWAICFNVIVLLGIKREPTTQGNSHFIQSLLQTMRMAINNPRVFLTPRLVNVQALALLYDITCRTGLRPSLFVGTYNGSPSGLHILQQPSTRDYTGETQSLSVIVYQR